MAESVEVSEGSVWKMRWWLHLLPAGGRLPGRVEVESVRHSRIDGEPRFAECFDDDGRRVSIEITEKGLFGFPERRMMASMRRDRVHNGVEYALYWLAMNEPSVFEEARSFAGETLAENRPAMHLVQVMMDRQLADGNELRAQALARVEGVAPWHMLQEDMKDAYRMAALSRVIGDAVLEHRDFGWHEHAARAVVEHLKNGEAE